MILNGYFLNKTRTSEYNTSVSVWINVSSIGVTTQRQNADAVGF